MKSLFPLLSLLTLTACGTAHLEPTVKTVEVRVAVPVACVPKTFPGKQIYPDTKPALLAAKGQDERYRLMTAGWKMRDARLGALEAQVDACR
jgi:hypothetical protein